MYTMKKLIIILTFSILSLISFNKSYAQSFNGGLIAGPTFCQVDGDQYAGFHKIGFTAGGYVNLPIAKHFAIQMELKYTQMGAHSSTKEVVEYYYPPYNLTLHYAEIPVMLRYDFGHFKVKGKPLSNLALELGVGLDFLLKYHGELDAITQYWKLNFFSVTGNFGVHYFFTDHFGIGARMMYSITPMQTNPTPQWFFDHSYNKVIQLTLTYNINSPVR